MLSVPSYYFCELEVLNANPLGRTEFFVVYMYSSKSFWSTFGRVHEGIFLCDDTAEMFGIISKEQLFKHMSENLALKSQDISMKFQEKEGEKNL